MMIVRSLGSITEKNMIIENGKIIEAAESELFILYLRREMDYIMDFNEYVRLMKSAGCAVVAED